MDTLHVILPVHNEVDSIESVLDEWNKTLNKLDIAYRIIICEDGSNDGTSELLQSLKKRYHLILNQAHHRRGYGKAVADGILQSDAQYVLCSDSDGQCDPQDFALLWKKRSPTIIVKGYRAHRADSTQRLIFSRMFGFVHKLLFPNSLKDPSAPFVLFNPKLIKPYSSQLLYLSEGFWWGFTALCIKNSVPIHEYAMNHRRRIKGTTNVFHLSKIPRIVVTNITGLIKLRLV